MLKAFQQLVRMKILYDNTQRIIDLAFSERVLVFQINESHLICCRYFTHHNRSSFPMQGKYLIHIPITCKENMKLKITFHKVESRSFALGNFILIICKELLHTADTYFLYKHTLIIFPDWKNWTTWFYVMFVVQTFYLDLKVSPQRSFFLVI